ncbi:F0F1 ATP synthase subunit gamma [Zavarzinia sp. CC-PAN008]|uniref:F0F1 ATP synthase subunit gamma n=1 Tax=Zavarzinia sp. CC-PAN008 TaxID=3243332 RepID=UPI003F7425E7
MASLRDLRLRIRSIRSTQKITKAMKMVAASKLRRAQEAAEAARPYASRIEQVLGALSAGMTDREDAPRLLIGTGRAQVHLLVVCTAERGLCGAFNSSIVRLARQRINVLLAEGKEVKILTVGKKGRDQLRRDHGSRLLEHVEPVGGAKRVTFATAQAIANRVTALFEDGAFDVCTLFYSQFRSAISQIPTAQQLIPATTTGGGGEAAAPQLDGAVYEYEPAEEEILEALLPRNLAVQIYRALLENAASEEGSRMSAMDSATRNAGDMINRLTLVYNRSRQATITKELIEIISGAEAL